MRETPRDLAAIRPRARALVNCPHCGAENLEADSTCRLCSKTLVVYIGPATHLPRRFSVGTLMGLVLASAPGLALIRVNPALGALFLVLLVGASIRTATVRWQRAEDGRPMGGDDSAFLFVSSVAILALTVAVTVGVATLLAMPIGAILFGLSPRGLPIAVIVSGAGGLYVGYLLLGKLWPHRG